MLEAAFVAGLATEGVDVHRLGVTPTPAVAFEAARTGSMGAVVSASHNPFHDNGIKLFAPGGLKLPDATERRIEQALVDLDAPTGPPGAVHGRGDAHHAYVEHLLDALAGRDLRGLRIVVDAANGAASHLAGDVFTASGAQVVVVNDRPDGTNINDRCGATDTHGLRALVTAERAHVGIALDGDADRLIAVDEQGSVVDGDHIIAICALDLRERGLLRSDAVVVTVMTNLGFRLAMERSGIRVVETAVGDRYVLEALADGGLSLGGEQSGHVIFAERATTGDGMLTALALLDVVQRSGRPLSALAASAMTRLPQVLINVSVGPGAVAAAAVLDDPAVAAEITSASSELGTTGRVLVRPSGTEPLIRVMVEAPTTDAARAIAERLAGVIRAVSA